MKVAVLLVLSILAVYANAQAAGGGFLTAYPDIFSWETIFANYTSYLDKIDAHDEEGVIYVSGEGYVHEIIERPFEFSIYRYHFRQHHHRFIDFDVFTHRNVTYIFGPVEARSNPWGGISHPIEIASLENEDMHNLNGTVQLAAVDATEMDDHVVVYGAGWVLGDWNCTGHLFVGFGVFRMFVHPNHTSHQNGTFISMRNFTQDFVFFPDFAGYTEYTREFKPWIFHSHHTEQVIVVDPATARVYRIHAPNQWNESMTYLASSQTAFGTTNITSAAFDVFTGHLVIGTRGHGSNPGTIICIDVYDPPNPTRDSPFKVLFTRTLNHWESNPKALEIHRGTLFVGFAGGSYILHLDLNNNGQVIGYSTVPFFAQNVHSIHAARHHLYIVTNEQYSKVARTHYDHFCSTPCHWLYGYCNNGTCACHPGHVLNTTSWPGDCTPAYTIDNVTEDKIISGHAGEVVLGLLFALFFVAAVLGWFVVWRNMNGKSVPFLGGNKRYSALHGEERESFLADD